MAANEDVQWPPVLLIGGSLISSLVAFGTEWSINVKIILLLAFINSIHNRLHPFNQPLKPGGPQVRPVNPVADFPSRNLWYSLVLSGSFSLISVAFKDAKFHSEFVGAGHFVQIVVDGVALVIGASYFMANAVYVSREQNSVASR